MLKGCLAPTLYRFGATFLKGCLAQPFLKVVYIECILI